MFVALLACGLVARGMLIGRLSIHFDEAMHYVAAKQSTVADVITESRAHTHPPLAFVMFHGFQWMGHSEVAVRLPSILFFVTSCLAAFVWLAARYGPWPALFGVALLCGSLPYIKLSCEMRGYTFLLTLVFCGLALRDRFLKSGSFTAVAGSTACLLAAMFTHYSIALLLLVLGVATLVHLASGSLSRRAVVAWCLSQIVLLAGCGVLASHARQFQSNATGVTLWYDWLRDSSFDPETTAPIALTLLHGCEFLAFLFGGPAWLLVLVLIPLGMVHAVREARRTNHSGWIAAERALLMVLPWIVALAAFHARLYPIGRTRHSMWLLPFLLAAVAAGLVPFSRRWPQTTLASAGVLVVAWFATYTFPPLHSPARPVDTPRAQRDIAKAIREHVRPGEILLTDDSTRYQLEFYLAGRQVADGVDKGDGFTEYEMDERRVLAAPVFYAVQFDAKEHSAGLARHMSPTGTWMLWANRGFETDDPRYVLAKCGIQVVVEAHRVGETWLVKALPPGRSSAAPD